MLIAPVSSKFQPAFSVIPSEEIRRFIPRTPLEHQFVIRTFPPLPRGWPASRQRKRQRANAMPSTLRSYWLTHRTTHYR